MAATETKSDAVEFWRLPIVRRTVGLSKTEIYRRIKDGRFPRQRQHHGSTTVYWLSSEIRSWQTVDMLSDDERGLLG